MADTNRLAPTRRNRKSPTAFRTISEVSEELDVPQHVLRFWETKFAQVRPMKRGGGRRYYRPEDVRMLQRIRELLYRDGYTIKGVQRLFREEGLKAVVTEKAGSLRPETAAAAPAAAGGNSGGLSAAQRAAVEDVVGELVELRDILRRHRRAGG